MDKPAIERLPSTPTSTAAAAASATGGDTLNRSAAVADQDENPRQEAAQEPQSSPLSASWLAANNEKPEAATAESIQTEMVCLQFAESLVEQIFKEACEAYQRRASQTPSALASSSANPANASTQSSPQASSSNQASSRLAGKPAPATIVEAAELESPRVAAAEDEDKENSGAVVMAVSSETLTSIVQPRKQSGSLLQEQQQKQLQDWEQPKPEKRQKHDHKEHETPTDTEVAAAAPTATATAASTAIDYYGADDDDDVFDFSCRQDDIDDQADGDDEASCETSTLGGRGHQRATLTATGSGAGLDGVDILQDLSEMTDYANRIDSILDQQESIYGGSSTTSGRRSHLRSVSPQPASLSVSGSSGQQQPAQFRPTTGRQFGDYDFSDRNNQDNKSNYNQEDDDCEVD